MTELLHMDGKAPSELESLHDLLAVLGHLDHIFGPPLETIRERLPAMEAALGPVEAQHTDHSRAITGLCDELLGLTREFAEYASIAGGIPGVERASCKLSALAEETDRRFAAQASSRGVRWTSRVVGEDAEVTVDPARFRQGVAQVVAFALNATSVGEEVGFEVGREGPGWRWTVVGIGNGLADESIERAFLPLFQIAQDSSGCPEGPTTGLALCRKIVESLGGSVAFEVSSTGVRSVTTRYAESLLVLSQG